MTSDERVERAAKAHFLTGVVPPRGCPMPVWEEQPTAVQDAHRKLARAALAAAGPDVPGENGCASPRGESGPDLLARLGTDAAKWCAEMVKRGVVRGDCHPGSWFHGWMCNAIENARDAGYAAGLRRANERPDTRGEANPLSSCGEKP
jgi:hypothetical protein